MQRVSRIQDTCSLFSEAEENVLLNISIQFLNIPVIYLVLLALPQPTTLPTLKRWEQVLAFCFIDV